MNTYLLHHPGHLIFGCERSVVRAHSAQVAVRNHLGSLFSAMDDGSINQASWSWELVPAGSIKGEQMMETITDETVGWWPS